ncbi:serine/threonine-protein phosphatase 7 long form homolog [Apium graveolens]|uniref:serine/threonine-protein phosphatase 7 long form homolog n=1 Tax=Apium graveolens TaxID=4045 RepID=UPI003D791E30
MGHDNYVFSAHPCRTYNKHFQFFLLVVPFFYSLIQIATSGDQNFYMDESSRGSDLVHGTDLGPIHLYTLFHVHSAGMTCYLLQDVHPGTVNPSLLHLQHTHRSLDIWRLGGGDMLKCRRKNPNNEDDLPPLDLRMVPLLQSTCFHGVVRVASLQLDWSLIAALVERWRPETHNFHLSMGEVTTLQDVGVLLGLPVDGDAVIYDVTPCPDMSWCSYVAELFGKDPDPKKDMNGSRVRLSFIALCAPSRLAQDASAYDIRFQVLCYLVHLFGGVLFTEHSGGLFHPMFLHFIRDLDRCGDYAWGVVVLAYLYRELCKTSKKDVDEVAGCLLLLQLWAWQRLPTLAPIRISSTLFDARFWEGPVAAPRGLRWLHGHSYTSTGGRTLPVIRTLLDGLGPSQVVRQFGLVQTIPVDVVYSEAAHSTNLRGNDKIRLIQKHVASTSIWAHRLDHLFVGDAIVAENAMPEYHPWYIERTVRFISHVGTFIHRIDLMFRQISERTQDVLPDVSHFADHCRDFVREYTLHGFDEMHVEVRRAR